MSNINLDIHKIKKVFVEKEKEENYNVMNISIINDMNERVEIKLFSEQKIKFEKGNYLKAIEYISKVRK